MAVESADTQQAPRPDVPLPPVGPGQRLREAREAAELTIAEVAAQLKLRRVFIEALERDEYTELPSLLFARGYLNTYARLLGLPPAEILASFEALELSEAPNAVPQGAILVARRRRGEGRLLRWGSAAVGAVVLALVIAWLQGQPPRALLAALGLGALQEQAASPPPAAPAQVEPAGVEPTLVEPAPPGPVAPRDEPAVTTAVVPAAPEPSTAAAVAPPAVEPERTLAASQPAPAPEPALEAPVAPEPLAAPWPQDTLVMELSGPSWAEVSDADGDRLVYGLLAEGTVHVVHGQAPFTVFLGNAPGVRLSLNATPVQGFRIARNGVARLVVDRRAENAIEGDAPGSTQR